MVRFAWRNGVSIFIAANPALPAIEILAPSSMESMTKNVRREGHQQG